MITIGQTAYKNNSVSYKKAQKVQEYILTNESKSLIDRVKAKVVAAHVVGLNLSFAEKTLVDWICLSAKADPSKGSFEGLEIYEKWFKDEDELTGALISNCLAAGQRKDEERLAFAVLEDFGLYERKIDEYMSRMIEDADKMRLNLSAWKYYYGPASELPSANGWRGIIGALNQMTELDRLYKKIAFFHDFARNVGVKQSAQEKEIYNKRRAEHEGMRHRDAKHSLNEKDADVVRDRQSNQSVWAGTSGSAMDMINVAMKYGMNEEEITALAWAIFAFFHFMPTIRSPTHTFIEVMRGAEKMVGKGKLAGIDTSSTVRPAVHYHDMDMSD